MFDYRAESCQIEDFEILKREWIELQGRSACSYFQSWGWMGTWLEVIVKDLKPVLVKIWCDEMLVGMGVFVNRNITRHLLFQSRALFLNEYPYDGRNMVIEYNGLLSDKGHAQAVYREVINHLINEYDEWDEFYFGCLNEIDNSRVEQCSCGENEYNLKVVDESPSWSVQLDAFESDVEGFMKTLSKNRRAQIRRSLKQYEKEGAVQLEEARTKEDALIFFDGLKELHMERWRLKGGQGSFINSKWEGFHRTLISDRFNDGEIQLLKVTNGEEAIGYLYNFIWHNSVYVLQTGFKMTNDKHLLPGYVAHVAAIMHSKNNGMQVYDLMHGDDVYKKILCNKCQSMYWSIIQRKRFKFLVEDSARATVLKIKVKLFGA